MTAAVEKHLHLALKLAHLEVVLGKVNGTEASTCVSCYDWVQSLGGKEGNMFQAKSEELYNVKAPKLNVELFG